MPFNFYGPEYNYFDDEDEKTSGKFFPELQSGAGHLADYGYGGPTPPDQGGGGIGGFLKGLAGRGLSALQGPFGQYMAALALGRALGYKKNPGILMPFVTEINRQKQAREIEEARERQRQQQIEDTQRRTELIEKQFGLDKKEVTQRMERMRLKEQRDRIGELLNGGASARDAIEFARSQEFKLDDRWIKARARAAHRDLAEREIKRLSDELGLESKRMNLVLDHITRQTDYRKLPKSLKGVMSEELYNQNKERARRLIEAQDLQSEPDYVKARMVSELIVTQPYTGALYKATPGGGLVPLAPGVDRSLGQVAGPTPAQTRKARLDAAAKLQDMADQVINMELKNPEGSFAQLADYTNGRELQDEFVRRILQWRMAGFGGIPKLPSGEFIPWPEIRPEEEGWFSTSGGKLPPKYEDWWDQIPGAPPPDELLQSRGLTMKDLNTIVQSSRSTQEAPAPGPETQMILPPSTPNTPGPAITPQLIPGDEDLMDRIKF